MLIGLNAQGAVNSLTPPCTGAAVMARGFIWPLDSVFFHFVTCCSERLPAFLRPVLLSSRQEVEAQMGCLYYTVVQIGAAAVIALWRFPRRGAWRSARWPSDVGRWLLRGALPVDEAVGSWNVPLFERIPSRWSNGRHPGRVGSGLAADKAWPEL